MAHFASPMDPPLCRVLNHPPEMRGEEEKQEKRGSHAAARNRGRRDRSLQVGSATRDELI
jgi:hypothetical protein